MFFINNSEKARFYKELKKQKNKEKSLKYYYKNKDKIVSLRSKEWTYSEKQKKIKRREYQRRYRQCDKVQNTIDTHGSEPPNRMFKSRALCRFKDALRTPRKRMCAIKAYLSSDSPTAKSVKSEFVNKETNKSCCSIGETVMENIKSFIHSTNGKRSNEARTSMNILCASVSGENLNKAKTSLAKKLGVPIRRLSSGKKIRHHILKSEKSCFELTIRKTRSDKTTETVKKLAYDFWLSPENSRTTGNKNDIKRKRIAPKQYLSHEVHLLEKTQTEIFLAFKQQYPNIKIGQRQFESYKPFFAKSVRTKDRNTCCCRQHVEIRSVFKTVMETRRHILNVTSECDRSEFPVFEHLNDVVEATLCEKDLTEKCHKKTCIDRRCMDCGVSGFNRMPQEIQGHLSLRDIIWEKYEYVDVQVMGGKSRRKLQLVKQCTKASEMYEYFVQLLDKFPAHLFRATWQNSQFRTLIDSIPPNHAVVIHDFSENFRCSDKTEIQSNYFQRTEVSIHVSILYRHSVLEFDGEESMPDDPRIVTEQFFVISPDVQHARHFTYHCQELISDYLKTIQADVAVMHEYTDGCSSQYKSRNCMGDVCNNTSQLGYRTLIRNYFETSHAKGAQDAAGGFLKNQADMAILRGSFTIRNAQDLFNFASKTLGSPKSGIYRRRVFRYVETIPRLHSDNYKPVNENRKIHQIVSNGTPGVLVTRQLSCYECESCVDGNIDSCLNNEQIGDYKTIKVSLTKSVGEIDDCDDDIDIDIKSLITEGLVIAVLADDNDFQYYLLKVTVTPSTLQESVDDHWGCTFPAGSEVVHGLYYDRIKGSPTNYRLIKKRTAIVHTAAVKYVCWK